MRLFVPVLLWVGAQAQWLNWQAGNAADTPQDAADGKPDLSGVWHVEPTPLAEMKRLFGEPAGFQAR
jgi:hypothetical protein